jgi:hypothetical protein
MTTPPLSNQAPKRRLTIALALVALGLIMVLAASCRLKQDYYGVWTMTGPVHHHAAGCSHRAGAMVLPGRRVSGLVAGMAVAITGAVSDRHALPNVNALSAPNKNTFA